MAGGMEENGNFIKLLRRIVDEGRIRSQHGMSLLMGLELKKS